MSSPRSDDPADLPEERGDIADAFAPPVPPDKKTRRTIMLAVLAVLAICVAVFVIALALR